MSLSPEWQDFLNAYVTPAYGEFLAAAEERIYGARVVLYTPADIPDRNQRPELQAHPPGYVAIGNDSGAAEILLRLDGSEGVYWGDAAALASEEPQLLHPSFSAWLAKECPLPAGPGEEAEPAPGPSPDSTHAPVTPALAPLAGFPEEGAIWLIKAPPDGVKGMSEIRKRLSTDWPFADLKGMMDSLGSSPVLLIESGSPQAVAQELADTLYRSCLAFGDDPDELVPLG